MLKEFNCSNFKSFGEINLFSMEASPRSFISEYPLHVLNKGDQRLLKCSAIYGANGSGKTNFIDSILFLKHLVLGNLNIEKDVLYTNINAVHNKLSFSIFFVNNNYEIGYHVIIKIIDKKIVFLDESCSYRNLLEDDFNSLFDRKDYKINDTECLLTKLFKGTNKIANQLKEEFVNIKTYNNLNNIDVNNFVNLEKTIKALNDLDINISNIFKENNIIYTSRQINENKLIVKLDDESSPIKKLINIIYAYYSNSNSIYLVDNLDDGIHPLVMSRLIKLFNDKRNNNKQFIFTSNDVVNMNNNNFRRDEIWFIRKNNDMESEIYPLSNIVNYKGEQIRKDAKYGKQYLEGRYGAIPNIK